jgi:hypothetical protein
MTTILLKMLLVNDPKSGSAHGMRNESYLISEVAFDGLSLPFSFRKDEILLIPCQTKAKALNEPVKPIQAKVQLVAHPVGRATMS